MRKDHLGWRVVLALIGASVALITLTAEGGLLFRVLMRSVIFLCAVMTVKIALIDRWEGGDPK